MIKSLDEFIEKNAFSNEVVVLEKTENSELIDSVKPCNKDFFENVFAPNGPYWSVYKELGFGEIPINLQYLVFVNERMYFCRNIEKQFLNSIGPKTSFSYSLGKLSEKIDLSLDNLLLLIAVPFDFAKQTAAVSLAAIRINEKLKDFEKFYSKSKKFWVNNSKNRITNPKKLAEESLKGALIAMKYSFYSSVAYSLKIKLADSKSWSECELENISKNPSRTYFGFYSKNPYDISIPRFFEDSSGLSDFKEVKFPSNPSARWRENCKFACARYLAILRRCYLELGKRNSLSEKVFFLNISDFEKPKETLKEKSENNSELFLKSFSNDLKRTLVYAGKWNFRVSKKIDSVKIKGIPAGGQSTVSGKAIFVNTEEDYKKDFLGNIVVSKTLSPNLTFLFDRISGLVSEGGGKVAHTAIVAVEQGMPCIVQANTESIKEGDEIRINGKTGEIEKL